jgi:hypothetical protein
MGTVPAVSFLNPDSDEWGRAWALLAKEGVNLSTWIYMGSYLNDRGWTHEFRGRCPETNTRTYIQVKASPGWRPE